MSKYKNLNKKIRCNFCGRPLHKVQRLIKVNSGMYSIYICEHCVASCDAICKKEIKNYEEIKIKKDY